MCMRTTVDIPEELLERACRAADVKSKRGAIVAGLKELIRKGQRQEIRRFAGRLDLDLDIPRARGRDRLSAIDDDALWVGELERCGTIRRAGRALGAAWLKRRPRVKCDVVAALLEERDDGR